MGSGASEGEYGVLVTLAVPDDAEWFQMVVSVHARHWPEELGNLPARSALAWGLLTIRMPFAFKSATFIHQLDYGIFGWDAGECSFRAKQVTRRSRCRLRQAFHLLLSIGKYRIPQKIK